jgi:UDP-2,3-diacylglucosamine hydrolase
VVAVRLLLLAYLGPLSTMHTFQALFISDLHLTDDRPELGVLFDHFITRIAPRSQRLYILGDFFEYWVNDDLVTATSQRVQQQLRALHQQGTAVYVMVGNRDFMLGERYLASAACQLITEPHVAEWHSTRVLCSHGDLLCTKDHAYQRYRRIARHPWMLRIARHLPLFIQQAIARHLRRISQQQPATENCPTKADRMTVDDALAAQWCQQHQCTALVHGHVHRIGTFQLPTDASPITRWVLGDWGPKGHYLSVDLNQQWQHVEFSAPTIS